MAHQLEALENSYDKEAFAYFWEMGLGKSKLIIDSFTRLWRENKINAVVLFSDKGFYLNWLTEISLHCPLSPAPKVVVYEAGKTVDLSPPEEGRLPVLLVNTESLSGGGSLSALRTFCHGRAVFACIDEATSIKGHDSKRSKRAADLAADFKYRRILTGTPNAQSPLDFYGQMRFLSPKILGTSFYAFRGMYAKTIRSQLPGKRAFDMVVGYQNLDHLAKALQPYCSRLKKDDCLDLPDKVYITQKVPLTSSQRKSYNELVQMAVTKLSSGEISTASQALQMLHKLRNVALGRLIADDGTVQQLGSMKPEVVQRISEEHNGKIIIWCAYKADIKILKETLKYGVCTYYGDMSLKDRELSLEMFLKDENSRFFIATPDTGGKSLTLVNSHLVIYYSLNYRLEHRLQSEDRAHRIGQQNKVTYIDLICPGTVEEDILKSLCDKQDLADNTLKALKQTLGYEDSSSL